MQIFGVDAFHSFPRSSLLACCIPLLAIVFTTGCGNGKRQPAAVRDDVSDLAVTITGEGYYTSTKVAGNSLPLVQHHVVLYGFVFNHGVDYARIVPSSWSFSLERAGKTIAVIDPNTAAQFGFEFALDPDAKPGSFVTYGYLNAWHVAELPFYGSAPPDKIVFRCSVKWDSGGTVAIEVESFFLNDTRIPRPAALPARLGG
jgi:hypothetical protein